jgi:hypothetical protein
MTDAWRRRAVTSVFSMSQTFDPAGRATVLRNKSSTGRSDATIETPQIILQCTIAVVNLMHNVAMTTAIVFGTSDGLTHVVIFTMVW